LRQNTWSASSSALSTSNSRGRPMAMMVFL
jgi:hypothetical protein